MLRDITIGQYYSGDSVIHRLDPRTKLVITLVYAVSLFVCSTWTLMAAATAFLVVYVAASRVPIAFILRGLKAVWTFILFTALLSVWGGDGRVLWNAGSLRLTVGGVTGTAFMVIRLVYLIIGSSVMTYTTRPMSLANGMESGMRFLKRFGVPVAEMAVMLMIALRFIPIFIEELDKIMKAQLSRGADFESRNLFVRLRSYLPVIVPLFASAVRRAGDLAQAMDARCYNGSEGRTRMNPLIYGRIDYAAYCMIFLYLAGIIAWRALV